MTRRSVNNCLVVGGRSEKNVRHLRPLSPDACPRNQHRGICPRYQTFTQKPNSVPNNLILTQNTDLTLNSNRDNPNAYESALRLEPRLSTRRYPQPQLGRLQLAINICCSRPGCGKRRISTDRTDRQTDTRPLRHTPCIAYYAGSSVNNPNCVLKRRQDKFILRYIYS